MNHAERDSSSQISDEDRGSAASKSEHRCDRVERGASLLEELRIMLDREDNQTPQPEQNVKEVDPSRRQFRFERGPSLLLDVQREMQSEPLQAPENAENGAGHAARPGIPYHHSIRGSVLRGKIYRRGGSHAPRVRFDARAQAHRGVSFRSSYSRASEGARVLESAQVLGTEVLSVLLL